MRRERRQRRHPLATPSGTRRPANQEERLVAAGGHRRRRKVLTGRLGPGPLQQPQRRRSVRGSATEATGRRDALLQVDAQRLQIAPQPPGEAYGDAPGEVRFVARGAGCERPGRRDAGYPAERQRHRITQFQRLQDRVDLVEAVVPPVEHLQREIDLRRRRSRERLRHRRGSVRSHPATPTIPGSSPSPPGASHRSRRH